MITTQQLRNVVAAALHEDAPWGDLTTQTAIPPDATVQAYLVARENGRWSGDMVFREAFAQTDAGIVVNMQIEEGAAFSQGQVLASVEGPARGILTAERIALNFVQRMSGIATLTAEYVSRVSTTRARIADTRKTTPGLRAFEKHAVVCGGGFNHRFGLSDAVMVKDNHLAVLQKTSGLDVTQSLRRLRQSLGHTIHIEVEVDRLDQIEPVLAADVDTIMLDNFSLEDLRRGVVQVAGRTMVEASGGIDLETVAAIAGTGVDIISVGALTHGVRSIDLGLDMELSA